MKKWLQFTRSFENENVEGRGRPENLGTTDSPLVGTSSALRLYCRLRSSRSSEYTLQRAVDTWGGKLDPKNPISRTNPVSHATFGKAAEIWNNHTIFIKKPTFDRPTGFGNHFLSPGVWLVINSGRCRCTIIRKSLWSFPAKVTDKGTGMWLKNVCGDQYRWRKAPLTDGIYVGRVGWVMQRLLKYNKTM